MPSHLEWWMVLLAILLLLVLRVPASQVPLTNEKGVKSAVFLSPKFVLGPGSVENKYYLNIDFPRGHIFLKEFDAEVVDEEGNPVPLHETYLHHWIVVRYYALRDVNISEASGDQKLHRPRAIPARNSGMCENTLRQYFGLGSETRRTATYVPDPYGIEVGNPAVIPDGYEERWLLNVHAIDTRGVEDRSGCTECRCDLYNITKDESGKPLRAGYKGGLQCCYDQTQCRLRKETRSIKRSLYLRYTVKWIDWEENIVPVKIYILDVTDTGKRANGSTSLSDHNFGCQVEYDVEACDVSRVNGCIDNKRASIFMPNGGYVIYGVAHQHAGGTGSALYGQDGRVICSSMPRYGKGNEAGNEAGYIVGMSTCNPQPAGSVMISDGETLTLESNYSSSQGHTGVMGLFYILVAEQLPTPVEVYWVEMFQYPWTLAFGGVALAVAVVAAGYRLKNGRENDYQYIGM